MDYKELKKILEEIQNQLYYHEESQTREDAIKHHEELEVLVDELQDLIK